MPFIPQGNAGTSVEVESAHRAMRVVGRPMDLGTRGAYALGVNTGVLTAALTGEVFQMRWTDATRLMLLRSVTVSWAVSTTAFVAGVTPQLAMRIARAFTADGTGGTAIVFSTSNTNKKRTSFPLSLLSDTGTRISTTAALGAGTKTLDTNRCALIQGNVGVATATSYLIAPTYLWQRNTMDEYPFVFAQNEGFIVEIVSSPGTGTSSISVQVEWAEVDPAAITGW